jgi:DNA-binding CsgD family transcriptional regulator
MELLDREQELAALDRLLEGSRAGAGEALVLRGEPGAGLTALLERTIERASGLRVARTAGIKAEQGLAFAALHRLCLPLLDRLNELPGPQRAAVARAFGHHGGDSAEALMVGLGVVTLLAQAAEEKPLLCVIDDAEWLDPGSAEALGFAARRVGAQPVSFVIAEHDRGAIPGWLDGISELRVRELGRDGAGELLRSVVDGPLDARVRSRLLDEAGGIPLALLELPAQLTPDQLAGLAALPEPLPMGERLRRSLLGAIPELPSETQTFLLLAAAEAGAPAGLVLSAAERLGLSVLAAAPAERRGLVSVGERVLFRHPLLAAAVYEAAPAAERQRVHLALAETIDRDLDPDRWAWHRAAGSLTPDEGVALEVELSATRARGRRDDFAAATLLEWAARLSPEPRDRFRRTLAATQAALAAEAVGRATSLLGEVRPDPTDELAAAQADRLRAAIGLAHGQGADRATVLLRAARALETLDLRLARDTYLEALEAAIYTGRSGSVLEAAEAARSAPHASDGRPTGADLLLDGLALLQLAGRDEVVPVIRRTVASLRAADEPRWLTLASLVAIEVWDDEGLHELTMRRVRLGREAHPLVPQLDNVLAGRFADMTAVWDASREGATGIGDPRLVSSGELLASAWRGRSLETRELAEAWLREAFARDLGLYVAAARYALAVLEIGLGQYEAALAAARDACEASALYASTAALPELVEAAVRTGERELAVSTVGRLAERTLDSGTDWALGTLARSRALLEEGAPAERLYREAIERLRSSRMVPQLARAHLLYGEWLRRERRRREAREQLRTARDMFIFMGAQAFAERARTELTATGGHAPRPDLQPGAPLTPREARVASLAGEGASNAEIAAQLYISPKTVEYHLHKVFRKLGVSSRTQLARVVLDVGSTPSSERD